MFVGDLFFLFPKYSPQYWSSWFVVVVVLFFGEWLLLKVPNKIALPVGDGRRHYFADADSAQTNVH